MSRINLDVNTTAFLREQYEKEELSRVKFFEDRQGKPMPPSKQMEVYRKKIIAGMPRPTADMEELRSIKPKNYHRKIINPEDVSLLSMRQSAPPMRTENKTTSKMSDMLPVALPIRKMLYDGFTHDEKGRYQYLNRRKLDIPEDRYVFPALSSWDYGWRLKDVIKESDIKNPKFGRTRVVRDTFYSRHEIPGLRRERTSFV